VCDRKYESCDLVQDDRELDELYTSVVEELRRCTPRVMTFEEVKSLKNEDVVWIEYPDKEDVIPAIYEHVFRLITNIMFTTSKGAIFPDIGRHPTYGKHWRCWNQKPTDEQRKMAEWK